MKYLVVDDSKIARKMTIKNIKQTIEPEIEILEAKDGQEAIDIYKEHSPVLCFMDLTMPIKNGFEATKEICEFDPDAKIIVITADIQELAVEKAKECGALGFINKPVDQSKLKNVLEALELI
jgi:two-component system chemotaxis response regulator CheY